MNITSGQYILLYYQFIFGMVSKGEEKDEKFLPYR